MSGIRSIRRAFRAPELGQAVADAVRRGWTARVDGAGHIKLSPPDGSRPERLSTTAYSGPSVTAQLARLRRKGALPERPPAPPTGPAAAAETVMDHDLTIALQLTEATPSTAWGTCAVCGDVIEPGAITCVSVEFAGWPTIRFHVACYVGFVRLASDFHQRVVLGPAWTSGPPA